MRLRMGKYEVIVQPGECECIFGAMEEVLTAVLIPPSIHFDLFSALSATCLHWSSPLSTMISSYLSAFRRPQFMLRFVS